MTDNLNLSTNGRIKRQELLMVPQKGEPVGIPVG